MAYCVVHEPFWTFLSNRRKLLTISLVGESSWVNCEFRGKVR
jgi:hypothetical protein